MQTLETNKNIPFQIDGKTIKQFNVRSLNFVEFVELFVSTSSADDIASDSLRKRFMAQVVCLGVDDDTYSLTESDLFKLPAAYASKLRGMLDADNEGEGVVGTVITPKTEGDAILAPILYKLGTPIEIDATTSIKELEFKADSYLEMEQVLVKDNSFSQALALLTHCCKPVGGDVPLLNIPAASLSEIKFADGFTIAKEVVPNFLN